MEIARRPRLTSRACARIDLLFTMSDITRAPATEVASARICCSHERACRSQQPSGGARRDRTDDLLLAKQALSQLSYGPLREQASVFSNHKLGRQPDYRQLITDFLKLVGLGRFELPTSRLSSARSNQLSYKPGPEVSNQKSVIRKHSLVSDY